MARRGEVGQKPFYILGAKPIRMGLAAEVPAIAQAPLTRGLLRMAGVVVIAEHLAHLIHELGPGCGRNFDLFFF